MFFLPWISLILSIRNEQAAIKEDTPLIRQLDALQMFWTRTFIIPDSLAFYRSATAKMKVIRYLKKILLAILYYIQFVYWFKNKLSWTRSEMSE